MAAVRIPYTDVQTPLSKALCAGDTHEVERLLEAGAALTTFVKGYSPQSLMCTLPMAEQPTSSVVDYPAPLTNVDPNILQKVDESIAEHIHRFHKRELNAVLETFPLEERKVIHLSAQQLQTPLGLCLRRDPTTGHIVVLNEPTHPALRGQVGAGFSILRANDSFALHHATASKITDALAAAVSSGGPLELVVMRPQQPKAGVAAATPTPTDKTAMSAANATDSGGVAPFDHYGPLQVGDLVRRGPHWTHDSDDMVSSQQRVLGKVTAVNGDHADVDWSSDPTKFVPRKGNGTYKYNTQTRVFDLFRVDPSQPAITASNLFLGASGSNIDRLRLGDIVRLHPLCTKGSYQAFSTTPGVDTVAAAAAACLGSAADNRLGAIVRIQPAADAWKGKTVRALFPSEIDFVVCVMALDTGRLALYPTSDLIYGDNSVPGGSKLKCPPLIATTLAAGGNTTPAYSSPSGTGAFKVNDVVRLRPDARDCRGCLGAPGLGFIGFVKAVNSSDLHIFSEESYGTPHQSSLNMPNHGYSPSDLILDTSTHALAALSTPLVVGDRVELASTFTENQGNGWCLGSPGSGTVGLVVLAPAPTAVGGGQRDVLVVAENDPSCHPYSFQAAWLQRAAFAKHVFAVGDRVRLEPAFFGANPSIAAGKCLAVPNAGAYGVVTSIGPTRDGIQRNVGVVALAGPHLGRLSLYPSTALATAHRRIALTVSDVALLKSGIAELAKQLGGSADGIDVNSVVGFYGLDSWQHLLGLQSQPDAARHSAVVSAYLQWEAARQQHGATLEDPPEVDVVSLTTPAPPGPAPQPHWTCQQCKMERIPATSPVCLSCKRLPRLWNCGACSCGNPPWTSVCAACLTPAGSVTAPTHEHEHKQGNPANHHAAVKPPGFKTRPCKLFSSPTGCKFGAKCHFLHPGETPAPKPIVVNAPLPDPPAVPAAAPKAHNGEWRAVEEKPPRRYDVNGTELSQITKYCCDSDNSQEGKRCQHSGGILQTNHWSCCGDGDRASPSCNTAPQPGRLPVGSFVKLAPGASDSTLGSNIGRIVHDDGSSNPYRLTLTDGRKIDRWFTLKDLVLATPAEAAEEHARRQKTGVMDVGSYVQLSPQCGQPNLFLKPGQIGMICRNDGSSNPFRVSFNGTEQSSGWYTPSDLVIVDASLIGKKQDAVNRLLATKTVVSPSLAQFLNCWYDSRAQLKSGPNGSAAAAVTPAVGLNPYDEDDDYDADVDPTSYVQAAAQDAPGSPTLALPSTLEIDRNVMLSEQYFHQPASVDRNRPMASPTTARRAPVTVAPGGWDGPLVPVTRAASVAFYENDHLHPLESVADLTSFVDRNGNSAAHHAAAMGLLRTVQALYAAGASCWLRNKKGVTPAGIQVALQAGLPPAASAAFEPLHRLLSAHALVVPELLPPALTALIAGHSIPAILARLAQAIKAGNETEAEAALEEAETAGLVQAPLYKALFLLRFDYGLLQAQQSLQQYEKAAAGAPQSSLDPLYFYVRYLFWKRVAPTAQPSYAKKDRLTAAAALRALRTYTESAASWVDPADTIDDVCARLFPGCLSGTPLGNEEDEEDDYSALVPPPGPDDPETLWELEKQYHHIASPAMDKLMQLTGLKQVKQMAIQVATSVLLRPPAGLKSTTSMNFLFVGNPGCGKTTVANLLATAMVELKYRSNPTPVIVGAGDLLAAKDPAADFATLVQNAKGGTLFIELSLSPSLPTSLYLSLLWPDLQHGGSSGHPGPAAPDPRCARIGTPPV